MKKILLFLIILANVVILTSCGGQTNDNSNTKPDDKTDGKTEQTVHTHKYSEEYSFDAEAHWLECSCGDVKDREEHEIVENEAYEANVCKTCGAVFTEENFYENIKSIGVDPSQPHNAYQVLLYSYYDADGDGYGDFAGLEQKLDYLADLGIDVIWLSPIMESESYHAYDITSFYKIDPKLGTIDDYLSLVDTAHSMDIKIVLDMPINHTSVNHEWFLEYLEDGNEYYQERQAGVSYGTSSSMGEKAKFYTDSSTGKSYFAAFGPTMPDLNYQSESLQAAIYEVFEYWMALGTDGFRFDAVKHIYDPNEIPANENSITLNNQLFQELGAHLKDINPNVYLLGENFSGQPEVKEYAESFDAEFDFDSWQKGLGAVTKANFWGGNDGRTTWDNMVVGNTNELIDINPNWIPTYMTGNHDVTRVASWCTAQKVTDLDEALKLYAAMITLRSGIPFIYYGDEIGMYGENKTGWENNYLYDSQIRLPMNFEDSTVSLESVFYSKTDNGKYLYENMLADWPSYAETNPVVEDQIDDEYSLFNTYKALLQFRTENPIISLGTMSQVMDIKGKATVISFEYEGDLAYVIYNFSESELELLDFTDSDDLELLFEVNGAEVSGSDIYLSARGVAVFTTSGELSISSGSQVGTISFEPGPWNIDGAWYAMYWWNSTEFGWVKVENGSVDVPESASNVIFCRMNASATTMEWGSNGSHVWNQTADLTIDGSSYTVTGWGATDGYWS